MQKEDVVISICIATYNRKDTLLENIKRILKCNRRDFNIVITDNCSDDGTENVIRDIADDRVIYKRNLSPLPGLNNMINSLYNGTGKYLFYCNDRDIIFIEEFEKLLDKLKNDEEEYAFVYCNRKNEIAIKKWKVYDTGYESLLKHRCNHHPSGCLIMREMLRNIREKEYYYSFLKTQYPLDYLIKDVVLQGKTALCSYGVWTENNGIFKKSNVSGVVVGKTNFFDYECITLNAKKNIQYISDIAVLSKQQKNNVFGHALSFFATQLTWYKKFLGDRNECIHYGRNYCYISGIEIYKMWLEYNHEMKIFFQDIGETEAWETVNVKYMLKTAFTITGKIMIGDCKYIVGKIKNVRNN